MTIAELQTDLIKLIVQTQDSALLQQMLAYFKSHQEGGDWWDTISDREKEMIEKGFQEIEEGKGIPYEQVRQEINDRIKKN